MLIDEDGFKVEKNSNDNPYIGWIPARRGQIFIFHGLLWIFGSEGALWNKQIKKKKKKVSQLLSLHVKLYVSNTIHFPRQMGHKKPRFSLRVPWCNSNQKESILWNRKMVDLFRM